MDATILQAKRHDAASAVLVHDEIDGKVFQKNSPMPQRLPIERMEYGVPGSIGSSAVRYACPPSPIPVIMPPKDSDKFFHPGVLEKGTPKCSSSTTAGGVPAHIRDGILVAKPIGSFDRVEHVPAPVVRAHVSQRRIDAALCGNRV